MANRNCPKCFGIGRIYKNDYVEEICDCSMDFNESLEDSFTDDYMLLNDELDDESNSELDDELDDEL